jgi:hypothetical protein
MRRSTNTDSSLGSNCLTVIDEETPDSDRLEALKAMSESGEQVPCDFRVTGWFRQLDLAPFDLFIWLHPLW